MRKQAHLRSFRSHEEIDEISRCLNSVSVTIIQWQYDSHLVAPLECPEVHWHSASAVCWEDVGTAVTGKMKRRAEKFLCTPTQDSSNSWPLCAWHNWFLCIRVNINFRMRSRRQKLRGIHAWTFLWIRTIRWAGRRTAFFQAPWFCIWFVTTISCCFKDCCSDSLNCSKTKQLRDTS